MRRRTLLGTVVSGVALGGGCLAGEEGGPPADGGRSNATATATGSVTPTRTTTGTPTVTENGDSTPQDARTETATDDGSETATERAPPLAIERANLVWSLQGADPIARNRVDAVGAGARISLGVRLSTGFEDERRSEHVIEGTIENGDGRQIDAFEQTFDPQDVPPGATPWYALPIDTTGFAQGTFTIEITARDERHDLAAEPTTVTFDVVEPLEGNDVELRTYSPETVAAGEQFAWEVTLRNLTDRTSSIDGTLVVSMRGEGSSAIGPQSYTIPAGSMVTYRRDELRFPTPGSFVFRLSPYDLSWEIDVTEAETPSTPA